jgi:hypothetical protein
MGKDTPDDFCGVYGRLRLPMISHHVPAPDRHAKVIDRSAEVVIPTLIR